MITQGGAWSLSLSWAVTSLLRGVTPCLVGLLIFFSVSLHAGAQGGAAKRAFTVKDSIEMSYIVNPVRSSGLGLRGAQPVGVPIYSPDGKYFLLVTQRGIVSSNALEATIWIFDRRSVFDYLLRKPSSAPAPRRLVTLRATSNVPLIDDLRWTDDSKAVAFLGKDHSQYQQLFLVNVDTGTLRALTKDGWYVTAYTISGHTIAYTTLVQEHKQTGFNEDFIDVNEKDVFELINRNRPTIGELDEGGLLKYPSSLHVQKDGKEIPVDFRIDGRPLRLFVPTLTLSPDASSLITVAPVFDVPSAWQRYEPRFEALRLKPGPSKGVTSDGSSTIAEQYVILNLETGLVSALVNAPAGRGLGYSSAPTEAFWVEDNRRVVLTNTYRPLPTSSDDKGLALARENPALVLVDTSTRKILADLDLSEPPLSTSGTHYFIQDVTWQATGHKITLSFKGYAGDPAPATETYALRFDKWVKLEEPNDQQNTEPVLSVDQDLNQPPVLEGRARSSIAKFELWNPNPELHSIGLGKASIYHWLDEKGKTWWGILALPAGYDATRRYPLVIQTHGYDGEDFFADGEFTTGSGGRALVAKDVIVLQMQIGFSSFSKGQLASPAEGAENLAGFESAVGHLVEDGFVDRSRVGVIGFSRTCFHVLYALTHRPSLFRAASITDGVNFGYMEYMLATGRDEYFREAETINGGAPFRDNLMKWIRDAPNFNLDKIEAPLLISAFLKGSLLSEWETYSGLRRLDKPVALMWWWKENTPHILVQPAQRYASQQSAVDWFDFWLNDREDPELSKADQYKRWRQLRKSEEARPKSFTMTPCCEDSVEECWRRRGLSRPR